MANISKALNFTEHAQRFVEQAHELLMQADTDAEGPIANAIQSLDTALRIVRECKHLSEEASRG